MNFLICLILSKILLIQSSYLSHPHPTYFLFNLLICLFLPIYSSFNITFSLSQHTPHSIFVLVSSSLTYYLFSLSCLMSINILSIPSYLFLATNILPIQSSYFLHSLHHTLYSIFLFYPLQHAILTCLIP